MREQAPGGASFLKLNPAVTSAGDMIVEWHVPPLHPENLLFTECFGPSWLRGWGWGRREGEGVDVDVSAGHPDIKSRSQCLCGGELFRF